MNGPSVEAKRSGVRILLIDDHAILREGLRALLGLEADFEVAGEAASVSEAKVVAAEVRPNLVITDVALPGESGLTLIPALKELLPGVRIIVLTAHCTDEYLRAALEVGADGYLLKDASRSELAAGIRAVVAGRQYFSSAVTDRVVAGFLGRRGAPSNAQAPITQRERDVLRLIAMACSTKHIASRLNISVKTVEKHRSNLMRKLELRNMAAVTLYAVRHNLVPVDVIGRPAQGAASEDE